MKVRQPGETLTQFAIRVAYEYGHFWNPENPDGFEVNPGNLKLLTLKDDIVIRALLSLSKMDATRYTKASLEEMGKAPDFNGEFSPAMESFIQMGRCPIPDFAPPLGTSYAFADPELQKVVDRMQSSQFAPAIGNGGNWPGCNDIGNFHCAAMRVNPSGINPKVAPLWKQILLNVRQAYAGIGLLWKFIGMDGKDLLTGEEFSGRIQTEFSFVQKSDGWIGLAIVTTNEGCQSTIWLKLLATYLGGTTDQQISNQQTTLLSHEAGHNAGLGHSNGGVMNPSIVNGLPTGVWPENDPSTKKLRTLYGGVPVPIPGGNPTPDPPTPNPPDSVQKQLDELRLKNIVQDVTIDWLVRKVRTL